MRQSSVSIFPRGTLGRTASLRELATAQSANPHAFSPVGIDESAAKKAGTALCHCTSSTSQSGIVGSHKLLSNIEMAQNFCPRREAMGSPYAPN